MEHEFSGRFETQSEWHRLQTWLMTTGLSPEEIMTAITAYQKMVPPIAPLDINFPSETI